MNDNEGSVKTVTYLLLGLKETAKIIDLESFNFWRYTEKENLQSYQCHIMNLNKQVKENE